MGVQASVFDECGENICKQKALQCNSKSHCMGGCSCICSNIRFVVYFYLKKNVLLNNLFIFQLKLTYNMIFRMYFLKVLCRP